MTESCQSRPVSFDFALPHSIEILHVAKLVLDIALAALGKSL